MEKTKQIIFWMFFKFEELQRNYEIAEEDVVKLSHLEIQKLLYFINGFYLAKFDKLLVEEKFRAWKYGPVIPEVYDWLKKNKNEKFWPTFNSKTVDNVITAKNGLNLNNNEIKFIKKVFNYYSSFSATQLVTMSHDGPWTWTKANNEIKEKDIKEYFVQELWNKKTIFTI